MSILRDLPYALRVKLVYDTRQNLLHTLSFFEDFDVPVITEMIYRLKPMQIKRKVSGDDTYAWCMLRNTFVPFYVYHCVRACVETQARAFVYHAE